LSETTKFILPLRIKITEKGAEKLQISLTDIVTILLPDDIGSFLSPRDGLPNIILFLVFFIETTIFEFPLVRWLAWFLALSNIKEESDAGGELECVGLKRLAGVYPKDTGFAFMLHFLAWGMLASRSSKQERKKVNGNDEEKRVVLLDT